jgi:phosphate transport system permease protein/phosphate transport system substrate-binding protein
MSTPAYAQNDKVTINGAGASFPFPLIDTWRVEYKKVNPNVSLNYQSIGSGAGIRQFTEKTVDFGGTDAPLTKAQLEKLSGPAVHIPETIGSVVVAYNVIGLPPTGLRLTGDVIADIYLGKIWRWDDPAIKVLNPDLPLPQKSINVFRRSDGSGTTFIWTDYLSSISEEWKTKVGKGTAVQWPIGRGAPGNEGVANMIRGTPNSLGYVELTYALTTGLQIADIKNKEGNFIRPSLESTKAAVATFSTSLPKGDGDWSSVSMVNALGKDSYPIASFSYLLLYKEMSTNPRIDSEAKAREIINFISWAISPTGQEYARKLSYVPLPDEVVKLNQQTLASLTYKGKQLYSAPGTATAQATSTPPPSSQEETKTYKAKLTLSASMLKSTGSLTLSLRNPATSDAQVYGFQMTLDSANVTKATAPRGWTAQVDGDTVTFSTETAPINKGRSGLFRITADTTTASIDWEAYDADGNVINAKTTAVRVR